MDTISIRDGLASLSPFCSVRSTDLWQYTAYFPTSLLCGKGRRDRDANRALKKCYTLNVLCDIWRNHRTATAFVRLAWGRHCVAGTVSDTKGNVVEEGTEPHTETTAANTTGRGGKRKKSFLMYYEREIFPHNYPMWICKSWKVEIKKKTTSL